MEKNWLSQWKQVDKPTKIRKKIPGTPQKGTVFLLLGLIIGIFLLFIFNLFGGNYWSALQTGLPYYALSAVFYWIFFLTMLIPTIFAGIIALKQSCHMYGFLNLGGWGIAAIIFAIWVNPILGWYMVFSISLIFLLTWPDPGNYNLKWNDLVYYFLLGVLVCLINTYITNFFNRDIWCYLQFLYFHLMAIIIVSLKIRQWGLMYMYGWILGSIILMFLPNELVNGIYNLCAPGILTWAVLRFFFRIWRPTAKKLNAKE
jgi:hypothetical protein